ncbi:hypothetical protein FXO38_36912 [Capsicum annuum]|nr:hypothetical protein FXO38_36912 [Capsicum annuum]
MKSDVTEGLADNTTLSMQLQNSFSSRRPFEAIKSSREGSGIWVREKGCNKFISPVLSSMVKSPPTPHTPQCKTFSSSSFREKYARNFLLGKSKILENRHPWQPALAMELGARTRQNLPL